MIVLTTTLSDFIAMFKNLIQTIIQYAYTQLNVEEVHSVWSKDWLITRKYIFVGGVVECSL